MTKLAKICSKYSQRRWMKNHNHSHLAPASIGWSKTWRAPSLSWRFRKFNSSSNDSYSSQRLRLIQTFMSRIKMNKKRLICRAWIKDNREVLLNLEDNQIIEETISHICPKGQLSAAKEEVFLLPLLVGKHIDISPQISRDWLIELSISFKTI